jgi:hypothetical protein
MPLSVAPKFEKKVLQNASHLEHFNKRRYLDKVATCPYL